MAAILKRRQLSIGSPSGVVAAFLGRLLTTRGQIIRRGSSGPEALAAQTANTFLGGDGTDIAVRTATQALTSLGLGMNSWSLADDTATSFNLPSTSIFVPCFIFGAGVSTSSANPWGIYMIRGSGTPSGRIEHPGTSSNVLVGAFGALTGTTHTDGNFNISAHSDGKVYLENRSGASRSGRLLFLFGA